MAELVAGFFSQFSKVIKMQDIRYIYLLLYLNTVYPYEVVSAAAGQ